MRGSWGALLLVWAVAACGGEATKDGSGAGGAAANGGSHQGGAGGAGGGGAAGGSGGGGLEWADCFGSEGQHVQAVLNACDESSTCLMVEHQIDCCGNIMFVGVNADRLADFEACEQAWRLTLPACGCPVGAPRVQQPYGQTVPSADDATVSCTNWTMESGVCLTEPA